MLESARRGRGIALALLYLLPAVAIAAPQVTRDINTEIVTALDEMQRMQDRLAVDSAVAGHLVGLVQRANTKEITPYTIDRMATLLDSDNYAARMSVARALGYIGTPAKGAIPALQRALDKDLSMLKGNGGLVSGGVGDLAYRTEMETMQILSGKKKRLMAPPKGR